MPIYVYMTPLSITNWIITITAAGVSRISDSISDSNLLPLPDSALRNWLNSFFEGNPKKITFDLDIPDSPPFYSKVWRELINIPWGETITYGELATRLDNQGAARAVGTACATNPLPLILPCHRVIASNYIGGFSAEGGVSLKSRLLSQEIPRL